MTTSFQQRISFLGHPANMAVPWSADNLQKMVDLGFNTMQLNVAWGCRPADEPLNLEDVVDVAGLDLPRPQPLPLWSSQEPAQIARRRRDLRQRIENCKNAGLRTMFHFGAPYNMHCSHGDTPPNCVCDPAVVDYHVRLLTAFAEQFPGVDDLLVYTYDQDAWLCSEFGTCPRCQGIPLHHRVSSFVNTVGETWQRLTPAGRLWWEPWELSAGQVLQAVEKLQPASIGLSLHSNVAEVIATMPIDQWLRNTVQAAKRLKIPVIVEHFLGGPTEEVEPFRHLCWPLVTLRALRAIAALHVDGIKEYYGCEPTKEDPNLRMTALFLRNPAISDNEALHELARPYLDCADEIMAFWRLISEAMDLFPWNSSWYIREVGKCNPAHSMDAAFLRGQQAHTPSWESSRMGVFMKTDSREPDPWLLEDIQLQCELAASRMSAALDGGERLRHVVPLALQQDFGRTLDDLYGWRQRTLSYAYHARETNLATLLRQCLVTGQPVPDHVVRELRDTLEADMKNQGATEPCAAAIQLLEHHLATFASTYFLPGGADLRQKGDFSLTSR